MTEKAGRKLSKGFIHIAMEVLIIVIVLIVIVGGGIVWRLSTGPMDITFTKQTFKDRVHAAKAGFDIDMGRVVLEWPDFKGPLLVGMSDVRLLGKDQQPLLNVDSLGIALSYSRLLLGQVRPSAIIIRDPALRITRTKDSIGLSLQEYDLPKREEAPTTDENWRANLASSLIEFADKDFGESKIFSDLEEFDIENAKVVIHDQVSGISRYFTKMNAGLSRSELGTSASVTVQLPGGRHGASAIGLDLLYNRKSQEFSMNASLQEIDPFIFAELIPRTSVFEDHDVLIDGQASIRLNSRLDVLDASLKLQSPEGMLVFEDLFDAPITYKNAQTSVIYKTDVKTAKVEELAIEIAGIPLSLKADAILGDETIVMPLRVSVPNAKAEQIASLVPLAREGEEESSAQEWLVRKLTQGVYKDLTFGIDIIGKKRNVIGDKGPLKPWVWREENIQSSFAFEDMTVKFSDGLLPANKAKGTGVFENGAVKIKGESAFVEDVAVTNMDMTFTDVMIEGGGVADIAADINGPLPTLLRFLEDDPIEITQEQTGIDRNAAKGNLSAKVKLDFPTIKELQKEQVKVKVDGTLSDLKIPDMVQGLELTGGPLNLVFEEGAVKVKGDALLAGRSVSMDWIQYLDATGQKFEMLVKASIGADKELRNHFGITLDDFIEGTVPVDLVFTKQMDDSSVIDVSGKLDPIRIYIEPFDYLKPSGTAGTFSLQAFLQGERITDIKNLKLETTDLTVRDATLTFRPKAKDGDELAGGRLPSAKIGKTSQSVDFDISPSNVWKIKSSGAVFDAEPFLRDKEKKEIVAGPAFMISMTADTMLTKKQKSVSRAKINVDLNTYGQVERLEMDAKAGAGDMFLRYKPDARGQRNFSFETNDAGATLQAFDVFQDMRGGVMKIYGEPVGGPNSDDIYGVARIENFRVVKAPALARLVSAMSLSGLGEALNDKGLEFAKLEAEFEWLFRPLGSLISVKDGRTSGSSLGLTFEGKVDRSTNTIDMKGTIIPLSGINNVLSSIPLVGDILTGGTGLVAATYTMTGIASEPKVSINPLSILAPGFLRTILFEGGFESDEPKAKKN